MKRSRRGLMVAALVSALPVLAACSQLSPTATEQPYSPGNGVSSMVGTVDVRDLLVVGSKGKEGLLSGALVNTGRTDVSVTVESAGQPQPAQVKVPAGSLVRLGGAHADATVVVGNLSEPAGSLMKVTLSSAAGGQVAAMVPILPASFEYATVTPTAD